MKVHRLCRLSSPGVRKEKTGKEVIDTFIPGMVMTIDKFKNPRKKIFKRLFAPTFSHYN